MSTIKALCSCRSVCFNQITEHTAHLLPTQLQTRATHALELM